MLIYEPIWFLYIALIGTGFFIQWKNTGSLLNLSISNIFYYFFFVNIALGTIAVYLKIEPLTIGSVRYHEKFLFWTILSVGLCGLIVPLGNYLLNLLYERPLASNVSKFIEKRTDEMEQLGPIFYLILLCLAVLFLYLRTLSEIPLFSIFEGLSLSELAGLRSDATNAFAGKYHRYSIFFHTLLPFLCFVLFSWHLVHQKKTLIIFSVIAITGLTLMLDLQKAPVVRFALGLFFVYLITRSKRLQPKFILAFVLSTVVFIVTMTRWFMGMGDRTFGVILNSVFERVVGGQVRPLYYYFEIFPSLHDFLGFKVLPNPGSLLLFKPFPITAVVHEHMFPVIKQMGIHGSAPTVFYGESYASFGLTGALACMFVIALLLGFADRIGTQYIKKDPLGIALFVWVGFHLSTLAGSGASFLFFDIKLMLIILTYIFLRSWNSKMKDFLQP